MKRPTMRVSGLAAVMLGTAALLRTALGMRPAANGAPTRLLRMPTVSTTQLAFAYANKI